jgi:hypothetical protein
MSTDNAFPDERRQKVQSTAEKSKVVAIVLGLLLSPASYYYVGRTKLAVINLVTLNYLTLGFLVVPIHSYLIVDNAEDELEGNTQM